MKNPSRTILDIAKDIETSSTREKALRVTLIAELERTLPPTLSLEELCVRIGADRRTADQWRAGVKPQRRFTRTLGSTASDAIASPDPAVVLAVAQLSEVMSLLRSSQHVIVCADRQFRELTVPAIRQPVLAALNDGIRFSYGYPPKSEAERSFSEFFTIANIGQEKALTGRVVPYESGLFLLGSVLILFESEQEIQGFLHVPNKTGGILDTRYACLRIDPEMSATYAYRYRQFTA